MFHRNRESRQYTPGFGVEVLENRQLLSASGFGPGRAITSIAFDQAPSAVQTGLENLATTDGLTAPTSTSTQAVHLNNVNGIETYTLDISGTPLIVDQNGAVLPVKSTTTWSVLNGIDAGSNAAAAGEISAIATALNLTAPVDATTIQVLTTSGGTSTYTVFLTNSSGFGGRVITVDSNGNPTGNENIPFSALPLAIQNGINDNLPTGANALDDTSTQTVRVRTLNGATTYNMTFFVSGVKNVVTVDVTGAIAVFPSTTTTEFDDLPPAAQQELQTWATNEGVAGTIDSTQSVSAYNEANASGTVIYSINLVATVTTSSGHTFTHNIVLSVDEDGNPTTLPDQGFGGRGFDLFAGFGPHGFDFGFGGHGPHGF